MVLTWVEIRIAAPSGTTFAVKVDTEDLPLMKRYSWRIDETSSTRPYVTRSDNRGEVHTVRLHRQLMSASRGEQVDHINRDTMDNRKANLRLCSASQNQANRSDSRGTSRYKGVSRCRRTEKWQAHIRVNRKSIALGRFDDEKRAAVAYDEAARTHFGEFACLNLGDSSDTD